jgi:photoactive yellow protein
MPLTLQIERLRDLIQQMRDENSALRTQNHQLRERLTVLQRGGGLDEETSTGPSSKDARRAHARESLLSSALTADNIASEIAEPAPFRTTLTGNMSSKNRDKMSSWQRSFESSDHLKASSLKRPPLGFGVPPKEALARGVDPPNSLGRPNVDLGYINDVPEDELDALPYGLIVLDREGAILFYNETESQMAGFAREQVLGCNFFEDVAPCTRIRAFQGRFEQFVRGELGRVTFFDFAFHFAHGTQNVVIGLSHGRKRGQFNVMLMRQ